MNYQACVSKGECFLGSGPGPVESPISHILGVWKEPVCYVSNGVHTLLREVVNGKAS